MDEKAKLVKEYKRINKNMAAFFERKRERLVKLRDKCKGITDKGYQISLATLGLLTSKQTVFEDQAKRIADKLKTCSDIQSAQLLSKWASTLEEIKGIITDQCDRNIEFIKTQLKKKKKELKQKALDDLIVWAANDKAPKPVKKSIEIKKKIKIGKTNTPLKKKPK